jgi:hypothetical protein
MFWMAVILMTTAIGVTAYNRWPAHLPKGDKACYTDDDGKTWFVDSAYKVVPFDHDGNQAFRALVFTYANASKKCHGRPDAIHSAGPEDAQRCRGKRKSKESFCRDRGENLQFLGPSGNQGTGTWPQMGAATQP